MWRTGLDLVLFVQFLIFPLCALGNTATEKPFRDRQQGRVYSLFLFCLHRHGHEHFVT